MIVIIWIRSNASFIRVKLVGLACEISSESTHGVMVRWGVSPARADPRSSDAELPSRLEARSAVRRVSMVGVDSRSSNTVVASRPEAGCEVRVDPEIISGRCPEVYASGSASALDKAKKPVKIISPRVSATYSRLPNLIRYSGAKLST